MKPEKALLAVGFSSEEADALRRALEPRLGLGVRAVSAELGEMNESERAEIGCVLVNLAAPRWASEQTLALSRQVGAQIPVVLLYEDHEPVAATDLAGADNVWGVLPKKIASPAMALNLRRAIDQFRERPNPMNEPDRRSNAITGLAGRETLREKLSESIELSEGGTMTGTMLIGLDGFKAVNRSFGHAYGDALLRMVAGRLRHCVRNADTLALWSSDEFAAVLEELTRPEDVVYVAQRIIYALSRPFAHEGRELFVTPSIGIALHPLHGDSAATLLQHADRAMYRSKRLGGNNYHLYSAHIDAGIAERLATEGRLRTALKNDHFELHYQPQLDVRDGRIIGLESLLRWNDPTKGLRPPLEFIPILEQSGLIVPVGEWVLRKACTQARAWQFAGLSELRVAVNLSPLQFRQAKLVERVESILDETGLSPDSLEIELTESSLMEDRAYAGSVMTRLKDMGVHIALDDFGTGYSALAMLKEFPVDTLKIDRAFIRDIADDVDDRHICSAIVKLGHDLRLSVVAEGVENENQLRILQSQGCHLVQGFLYARPMPANDTWEWLTGHKAGTDDLAV